jgi:hypothetical protein
MQAQKALSSSSATDEQVAFGTSISALQMFSTDWFLVVVRSLSETINSSMLHSHFAPSEHLVE